jgi:hypothetical protein
MQVATGHQAPVRIRDSRPGMSHILEHSVGSVEAPNRSQTPAGGPALAGKVKHITPRAERALDQCLSS